MAETGVLGTESSTHPTPGPSSLLTRLWGFAIPRPQPACGKDGTQVVLEAEPPSFLRSTRGQVWPGFTLTPPAVSRALGRALRPRKE